MKSHHKRTNAGFTIIEVMFVIAIAGLILIAVYLTASTVRRENRDTDRLHIANQLESELEAYSRDNSSGPIQPTCSPLPTGTTGQWCNFLNQYLSGNPNVADPSTGQNILQAYDIHHGLPQDCNASGNCSPPVVLPAQAGELAVVRFAKCKGDSAVAFGGVNSYNVNFAVVIGLDKPGVTHCVDNQ